MWLQRKVQYQVLDIWTSSKRFDGCNLLTTPSSFVKLPRSRSVFWRLFCTRLNWWQDLRLTSIKWRWLELVYLLRKSIAMLQYLAAWHQFYRSLGILLHSSTLRIGDLRFPLEKIDKKLAGWKRNTLTLARQLTLINAVQRAILLYWMSILRIPEAVIHRIDRICKNFLWEDHGQCSRIKHLAAWDQVCRSKDVGGLGRVDLHTANQALLIKWWWKYFNDECSLWQRFDTVNILL